MKCGVSPPLGHASDAILVNQPDDDTAGLQAHEHVNALDATRRVAHIRQCNWGTP